MDTTIFMRPGGLAHHTCGDWASEHALHAHELVIPLDAPVQPTHPGSAHDAPRRLLAGAPITQAALDAGFSDHAHLTRTMRALFGQPPSYVAG